MIAPNFKIKRMTPNEIDAANAMYIDNYGNPNHSVIDWLNETINDPFGYLFVAFWRDELAGYCGMYHNTPVSNPDIKIADYCKICDIVVKKDFRQKGIGRAMMTQMLNKAKELRVGKVKLEVSTNNNNAIKLYESLGFKTETTEKAFYDDGEDAYIMWRDETAN